ncbi:hypothetical protein S83_018545 [Arachis hypogaea]
MESMRRYWKRRGGYHRLNGSNWWRRRHKKQVEQLGTTDTGATNTRRRTWRIKVSRKIRISRIPSPKKFLLWLRDSYVRMMLGVANSKVMSMSGSAVGYGGRSATTSMALGVVNSKPVKEYDEKMIVHIYKSLVMAQQQGHDEPQKFPSQITCP